MIDGLPRNRRFTARRPIEPVVRSYSWKHPATAVAATALLTLLLSLLLGATSCSTVQRAVVVTPHIEGATFVGNQQCFYCHTNYAHSFQGSVHFRVNVDAGTVPGGTSCESCHGPGSRHVEAPRERAGLILNPRKDPQACFTCHLDIQLQFRLPQHHPVIEGQMNCVQCHDPHGREIFQPNGGHGLAMARLNDQCASCHREQARPFVFEHEALREGCISCHEPHGSINSKMITQRDSNLCLKCHAQVQSTPGEIWIGKANHKTFLSLGTCWSAGCHTAVHGSNFQPKLLY
jgi:predicted CXXCH cytochrome family protein